MTSPCKLAVIGAETLMSPVCGVPSRSTSAARAEIWRPTNWLVMPNTSRAGGGRVRLRRIIRFGEQRHQTLPVDDLVVVEGQVRVALKQFSKRMWITP